MDVTGTAVVVEALRAQDTGQTLIALLTMVTAAFAALSSFMNRKKIHEVHVAINSRLTELLAKTEEAAHLKGTAEGAASEQARVHVDAEVKKLNAAALKETGGVKTSVPGAGRSPRA